MTELDCKIGLRIRALLNLKKVDIHSLAKELGIGDSTFRAYLDGRRKTPNDVILDLSKRFNCSIDYFYTGNISLLSSEADLECLNAIVIRADSIADPERRKQYYRDAINMLVSRI